MTAPTRPPRMPLQQLRRRYDALGPLEEAPGERTFLGRCGTWEGFLAYGPLLADALAESDGAVPPGPQGRALAGLAREAWAPAGSARQ